MTRGILIAGNESSLFLATAAQAVQRVQSFAAALIPNRFPQPEDRAVFTANPELAKATIPLSWNPASSISARTVVLAAENRLQQINDAILICSPPALFKTAEALTPEEIEILVNDQIKGWFFLIRELSLYFRRRGEGTLSLVTQESGIARTSFIQGRAAPAWSKNTPLDILSPPASASFKAFAQGVLASQTNQPFRTMGFSTAETGSEDEFAAWFFKAIDDAISGSLHANKKSGSWCAFPRFKILRKFL